MIPDQIFQQAVKIIRRGNPVTHRTRNRSQEIFRQAEQLLVGGVNSPVRAFKAVGGEPLVIDSAVGAHLLDADGNEYIDYVCSWGALILGHVHPAVTAALAEQVRRGTSYGMTSELEVELARSIARALPALEMIRFVSSGTEATMSAVRVARAFTGRNLILKFEVAASERSRHADGAHSCFGAGEIGRAHG